MLPHWTENEIEIKDDSANPSWRIHYARTGGTKLALVLAHGFTDDGLCWSDLACRLEDNYDILLPDARGHGRSARVQPGQRVDHAADLAGFIQAMQLDRPVLGGHSMGASASADLVARFPGLVRALILEDPAWFDPRPTVAADPKSNPWFDWLRDLPGTPLETVMEKCRQDSPTWPEVELRPWAESKLRLDTHIFETDSPRTPWREVAAALTCPTLLITADPARGAIITPAFAAEAARLAPNLRVVNIPGAGHCIRREQGAAYLAAVRMFLEEVG